MINIFQGCQAITNCRFYRKQEGLFNLIDSLFSLTLFADFEFFTMYGEAFFCAFFFFCFSDNWFVCLNCCVASKFVAWGKIINFLSSSCALLNDGSIYSCANSSNFWNTVANYHGCRLLRHFVFASCKPFWRAFSCKSATMLRICTFGKLSANPSFWQPL